MPAILHSLFHKIVNTTSTPIGVEGRGAGEPRDGEIFRLKENLCGQISDINSGCFQLHISKM